MDCKHMVFNDDGYCGCRAKKLVYVNEWVTVADFGEGVDAAEVLKALEDSPHG